MLMISASLFYQLLSAWLFALLCCSEKNLAFTALSSQHALPQDLGSGQVSLFSLCTTTRLGSNSTHKIRKKLQSEIVLQRCPLRGSKTQKSVRQQTANYIKQVRGL